MPQPPAATSQPAPQLPSPGPPTAADSLYFCVVSITTVGFGDIVPKRKVDKLFVCFYLLFGVWVLGYTPSLTSTLPPNLPLHPVPTLALTLIGARLRHRSDALLLR